MNKEITKKIDPDETKKLVLNSFVIGKMTSDLLKEIGEDLLPSYKKAADKEKEEIFKKLTEKAFIVLRANENDSHIGLMESVNEGYQDLAQELSKQIHKEYNCLTSIEKSLAGSIVNAHIRVLDNSRRLNNELNCREITKNRTCYIATLSKQLDRAHRQFLNSVMVLKQLKSPTIEMNIRANTAFVANTQQVNVEKKPDEIIKA